MCLIRVFVSLDGFSRESDKERTQTEERKEESYEESQRHKESPSRSWKSQKGKRPAVRKDYSVCGPHMVSWLQ